MAVKYLGGAVDRILPQVLRHVSILDDSLAVGHGGCSARATSLRDGRGEGGRPWRLQRASSESVGKSGDERAEGEGENRVRVLGGRGRGAQSESARVVGTGRGVAPRHGNTESPL